MQQDIAPTDAGDTSLTKIEANFTELYGDVATAKGDITDLEAVVNNASASAPASIDLAEDTDNGTNKITITAPSAVASDKVITLPDETGTVITDVSSIIASGWMPSGETWTYSSVDDPTGVITISGDKTTKYSAGMRIKFVNGGNTIYGIITVVAYSAPNTVVTFLHQIDPTDSLALALMANSAITANYYSTQKSPLGFPLSPSKWTVEVADTTQRSQASPTQNVWYNLGSVNISVPIGIWKLSYRVLAQYVMTSATEELYCTLSTANNSESDAYLTSCVIGTGINISQQFNHEKHSEVVASKTSYFLNSKHLLGTTGNTIYNRGDNVKTIIRAICAYL